MKPAGIDVAGALTPGTASRVSVSGNRRHHRGQWRDYLHGASIVLVTLADRSTASPHGRTDAVPRAVSSHLRFR